MVICMQSVWSRIAVSRSAVCQSRPDCMGATVTYTTFALGCWLLLIVQGCLGQEILIQVRQITRDRRYTHGDEF